MDTVLPWVKHLKYPKVEKPWWLGLKVFHLSHQSNLTRKKPEWYSQFWSTPPDLEYFWPTHYKTNNQTSVYQ